MEKTIDIPNGPRMTYTLEGSGERTAVLMHGWGCTGSTLASLQAVMLACGLRVLTVDFPGFGASEEPPAVWGVDDYACAMEHLLRNEAIERPILLGHSFGGRVGIVMASRNPVEKLILVDAAGIKPRRGLKYYAKVYAFKASKRMWRLVLGRERAEARIERARQRRGSSDYAQSSPRMRAVMSRVVNEDLRHLLPAINCPTLLVWGENDTATPLRDARLMERLIPDAGLVAFPGAGHYSFLDNTGRTRAVLTSFLNS